MNNTDNNNSIANAVMSQIKHGQTKMRPRWYFILRSGFFVLGICIVLLVLIFASSLVLFMVSKSGLIYTPLLGLKGIKMFVVSLPWITVLFVVAFALLFEVMIRHYRFTYKRPLFYSVLGIVIILVSGTVLAFKVGVHEGIMLIGNKNGSITRGFYKNYVLQRIPNIHFGSIHSVGEDNILLKDNHDDLVTVTIFEDTDLPEKNDFEVGDQILVLGSTNNGMIEATAIKRVNQRTLKKINNIEKKRDIIIKKRLKKD